MLQENDTLSTTQIYNAINNRDGPYGMRHGVSTNILGNILAKDKKFIKVRDASAEDAPKIINHHGHHYKVALWALNWDEVDFPNPQE